MISICVLIVMNCLMLCDGLSLCEWDWECKIIYWVSYVNCVIYKFICFFIVFVFVSIVIKLLYVGNVFKIY